MADPDYLYDPEDWECTYEWADRDDAADHLEIYDGIKKFKTLMCGPDVFCARIDNEFRWFGTQQEAQAALDAAAVTSESIG